MNYSQFKPGKRKEEEGNDQEMNKKTKLSWASRGGRGSSLMGD